MRFLFRNFTLQVDYNNMPIMPIVHYKFYRCDTDPTPTLDIPMTINQEKTLMDALMDLGCPDFTGYKDGSAVIYIKGKDTYALKFTPMIDPEFFVAYDPSIVDLTILNRNPSNGMFAPIVSGLRLSANMQDERNHEMDYWDLVGMAMAFDDLCWGYPAINRSCLETAYEEMVTENEED